MALSKTQAKQDEILSKEVHSNTSSISKLARDMSDVKSKQDAIKNGIVVSLEVMRRLLLIASSFRIGNVSHKSFLPEAFG